MPEAVARGRPAKTDEGTGQPVIMYRAIALYSAARGPAAAEASRVIVEAPPVVLDWGEEGRRCQTQKRREKPR